MIAAIYARKSTEQNGVNTVAKLAAAATFVLLCLANTAFASPLTVRCSAETTWGNQTIQVLIDIALPDKADQHLFVADHDGKNMLVPDISSVGMGKIEISERLYVGSEHRHSHRHSFIVTRMPNDQRSLVGFYVVGTYVNSISAELWKEEKAFVYFDSYHNEVLRGKCE